MWQNIVLKLFHIIYIFATYIFSWIRYLQWSNLKLCKQTLPRLQDVQSDGQNLNKLPVHVGFVIVESRIQPQDIANVLLWCISYGIKYISLYDKNGMCKSHQQKIHEAYEKQKHHYVKDANRLSINVQSGLKNTSSKNGCNAKETNILLLSQEDGQPWLAQQTRHLTQKLQSHSIKLQHLDPTQLDIILKENAPFPDPDLILRFGTTDSLLGYLPWHIRLSEIIHLPTHKELPYENFRDAIISYGDKEQRFGK